MRWHFFSLVVRLTGQNMDCRHLVSSISCAMFIRQDSSQNAGLVCM